MGMSIASTSGVTSIANSSSSSAAAFGSFSSEKSKLPSSFAVPYFSKIFCRCSAKKSASFCKAVIMRLSL